MRYVLAMLLLTPAPLLAQECMAIRNATVETMSPSGRLEKATIVARDGKIVAVGKDVDIPADAVIVDADGGTVMPGIIDPYFEVSIAAATPDSGGRTTVVRGRPVNIPAGFGGRSGGSFTRIADNFYAADSGYKNLPRVGLTALNLVSSGNGQSALVRVTPNEPDKMMAEPDGAVYATVTNSTESLDQIRTKLTSAARAVARPSLATSDNKLWIDVVNGKTPLVVQASSPAAVAHLLKAVESYSQMKLVLFLTADSIAEAAPTLKERKVKVLLRPSLELLPNSRDRFNPARMLHEAGVDFSFSMSNRPTRPTAPTRPGLPIPTTPDDDSSTSSIDQDFPLFPIAMLVKTGLPRVTALESLTRRPAKLLGLDATHGSIEVGKAADLLLFTGDPLDPGSRLVRTIIAGRTTYAN